MVMKRIEQAMMWRRLDGPGHDVCAHGVTDTGWRLLGSSSFLSDCGPCSLGYLVDADAGWRVRSAHVFGTLGTELVDVFITAKDNEPWLVNGRAQPGTAGCIDLELDITPGTKLFALRRLAVAVGNEEGIVAAHLVLPELSVEPIGQHYKRLSDSDYLYTVAGSKRATVLRVDGEHSVIRWPGRYERESATGETGAHQRAGAASELVIDRHPAQREVA
jgi:uncharacterized protein